MVVVDLQKAFDTVDHDFLAKKLYLYGARNTFHLRKVWYFVNVGGVIVVVNYESDCFNYLAPRTFLVL